jgi:branched-chain amino acid transport system substrate-binding protein
MRTGRLAWSGLALALAAAAIGGAATAEAADTYTLNAMVSLTGPAAFLGKGEQQALTLAEKVVNDSGGIKGAKLAIAFHDDQTNPQVAVQIANDLIAQKPAVILGSTLVATCRAIAPLMKDGPVDYCLSPGIHPDAGSYVFTASVSTLDLANAMVRYFRLRGWHRIALMFSTDASGQDAEHGLKSVLALPENKDMQLVATAHFNITDLSVAAQLEDVKAHDPQCFIAWSTGTPIGTIFRGMIQAGLDVPTGTTDGNMTYAQMTQYADFLPKQLYIAAAQWAVNDPALLKPAVAAKSKEFYGAFAAAGLKPDIASELGWEPGMILVHALRTLGPQATAPQIRGFLQKLTNFGGVNGVYDFVKEPQRGLNVSDTVVTRWNPQAKTWQVMSKATGVPLEK